MDALDTIYNHIRKGLNTDLLATWPEALLGIETFWAILGCALELRARHDTIRICEVGVCYGRTSELLAALVPDAEVHMVDNFSEVPTEWIRRRVIALQSCYTNLFLHEGNSVDIAQNIGDSFHLIFIDANHNYDSIRADITAWENKVIPGGYFIFHDTDFIPVANAIKDSGVGERMSKCTELTDRVKSSISGAYRQTQVYRAEVQ